MPRFTSRNYLLKLRDDNVRHEFGGWRRTADREGELRRLGETPLTGAEKQKRHRERVKARLAEAAALRARYGGVGGALAGLPDFFAAMLRGQGASEEEVALLCADLAAVEAEAAALLRGAAEKSLETLRARRGKAKSSLLSRLAAMEAAKDA